MASAPANDLPLFYKRLEPLSSNVHGAYRTRMLDGATFLADHHAIPLTAEEFAAAQRHYPIVFASGPNPVPLALFGLNEGVNVFIDEAGKLREDVYIPAYVRRYPFMLARLTPDGDELSLCFDPTSDAVGAFDEGNPLFDAGQPSQTTRDILGFCEQFEGAGQRTTAFVKELEDLKLLIEGEVTIQPDGAAQPFVYRGFKMVSEEALRELRGDVARRLIQSGVMGLIYAHLFSLTGMSEIFARQQRLGKVPTPSLVPPLQPIVA